MEALLSWFITFRCPLEIWQNHWTLLGAEISLVLNGILTFVHAWRRGGRWLYLWLAIFLHGFVVESMSYYVPDIDNFWHAQATVMLLGQRLPIHVTVLYPVFIYTASVAASKMKLPCCAEPFAVGLLTVLIDIPLDIMGIKLLWWTWHDTDPNIYDRHYWVPWTSYYFHAAFASSLTFLIHGSRRAITGKSKYQTDSFPKEMICVLVTALLATPVGILQFLPIYHPLHDLWGIHSEVCVLLFLSVYGLRIWTKARRGTGNRATEKESNVKGWRGEISLLVILHYGYIFLTALISKPENTISEGLHEPIGDCNLTQDVHTPVGVVLTKRKYLCVDDYDESYYDWHCLPIDSPPTQGAEWYTVCGTPFPNHLEYIIVVGFFCFTGVYVYLQLLLNSNGCRDAKKSKVS